MIVYFQVPLISWRDGKANSHQCYNGKAETEPGLFHSVFSTCHPASLFSVYREAKHHKCSAAQQVRPKSPHKRSFGKRTLATALASKCLDVAGPLPPHFINSYFVTGVLMFFKVTLGRASAVWSPAKQKFTASMTDPALRHAGKESDEVCEGGGKKEKAYSERGCFERNG